MTAALPVHDRSSEPYWAAAREGRLLIQRCTACKHVFGYARPFCPLCWSGDVAWLEASGRATLYTWSIVHVNDLPAFRADVPYVAAVVDLAEGVRMSTRIVDCKHDQLIADMPLRVTFRSVSDEVAVPVFTPA